MKIFNFYWGNVPQKSFNEQKRDSYLNLRISALTDQPQNSVF